MIMLVYAYVFLHVDYFSRNMLIINFLKNILFKSSFYYIGHPTADSTNRLIEKKI